MSADRLFPVAGPTDRERAPLRTENQRAQVTLFDLAPTTPAAPCAVCDSADHLTAGCPEGIAADLFTTTDNQENHHP